MEIRHDLLSRNLTDTEVRSSFDWILACLSRHGVTTVSVTFDYDCGDWQHETVELAGVRSRVEDAEAQQLGSLGTDDLNIEVEGVVQIEYCHHADIHLAYIQPDHPLARALATCLPEAIGLHEQ